MSTPEPTVRRLLVRRLTLADGSAVGPATVTVRGGKVVDVAPFTAETPATTYIASARVCPDGTLGNF